MSTGKQTKGFLIGAIAGGIVGSVTALLLAPKAGKELRQDISVGAHKISESTVKVADQVTDTTGRIAKQIGGQAVQIAGKTRQAAGTLVSSVRSIGSKSIKTAEVTSESIEFITEAPVDGELEASALEAVEAGETEAAASKEQ